MRKLLTLLAVIAMLCVSGVPVLADSPAVSAQPNIQPDPQGSTAGGSASASGGDAGPATFSSIEPITASSSNTAGPNAPAQGSTSATGPGTTATVPTTASASDPQAPDGSTPTPTTSGPAADADASQTNVSTSDSRVRANAIATVRGSFAGSVAGIGSVDDPTLVSTCSTAEAAPGVPTDVSLGTQCGTSPSSASEDFSAFSADGNGASGTPSGSACLVANASADLSPTSDLSSACSAEGAATPSTSSSTGTPNANGATGPNNGGASTDPRAVASAERAALLGILGLPSTATAPETLCLLGVALVLAGLGILRSKSRRPTERATINMTRFADKIGRIRVRDFDREALIRPHSNI